MNNVKEIIFDETKLSEWSVEIDSVKDGKVTQQIIKELKATMRENGLEYLTAPQIGYEKRIFCIRFGKDDYRSFINPMIDNNANITMVRETCNSIPGKTFVIPRFNNLKFYFTTPLGKAELATLVGRAAHVAQHAMDHLNGLLVSDIGLEIDEMFDNATDEEREEVIRMYAESLDLQLKNLKQDIEENEDLKQLNDAIDFMHSVKEGKTILNKSSE